jgi:hypothetical protein
MVNVTNILTIGIIYPHSIIQIHNNRGELLFDMRQYEDGTVKSDIYNLDEAATLFFDEVMKRNQDVV